MSDVADDRGDGLGELLPAIGKPALNALAAIDVTRASQLVEYSEADLLALHGVGPKAVRLIREAGIRLRES